MSAVTIVQLDAATLQRLVEESAERGAARALQQAQIDLWLDADASARHVYGTDGKREAFHQLRRRHPEIDAASVGAGKLRRWRRSALDLLIANLGIRRPAP